MKPGKNPGGCSRLLAKAFAGVPANTTLKKLNKINRFSKKET